MSDTTNVSLRISTELLERVDAAASHAGMNRTAYMISWLPENYADNAEPAKQQHVAAGR